MHHRRDDGDDGDDDDDNGVGRGGDRIMAELIAAYESLTNGHDDDFRTGGGNSMVALACETYTLDELRGMRRAFDVRSFRVEFGNHRSNDDEDVMDGTTSALDASTRRPHDDGHSGSSSRLAPRRTSRRFDIRSEAPHPESIRRGMGVGNRRSEGRQGRIVPGLGVGLLQ